MLRGLRLASKGPNTQTYNVTSRVQSLVSRAGVQGLGLVSLPLQTVAPKPTVFLHFLTIWSRGVQD